MKYNLLESLKSKADKAFLPLDILIEVYQKGVVEHTQLHLPIQESAMNRVNSYIAGGRALELDEDIAKKLNFHILGSNDTDRTITASVNGKRYEYHMGDGDHQSKYRTAKEMHKKSPGRALNWIKQRAKKFEKLDENVQIDELHGKGKIEDIEKRHQEAIRGTKNKIVQRYHKDSINRAGFLKKRAQDKMSIHKDLLKSWQKDDRERTRNSRKAAEKSIASKEYFDKKVVKEETESPKRKHLWKAHIDKNTGEFFFKHSRTQVIHPERIAKGQGKAALDFAGELQKKHPTGRLNEAVKNPWKYRKDKTTGENYLQHCETKRIHPSRYTDKIAALNAAKEMNQVNEGVESPPPDKKLMAWIAENRAAWTEKYGAKADAFLNAAAWVEYNKRRFLKLDEGAVDQTNNNDDNVTVSPNQDDDNGLNTIQDQEKKPPIPGIEILDQGMYYKVFRLPEPLTHAVLPVEIKPDMVTDILGEQDTSSVLFLFKGRPFRLVASTLSFYKKDDKLAGLLLKLFYNGPQAMNVQQQGQPGPQQVIINPTLNDLKKNEV